MLLWRLLKGERVEGAQIRCLQELWSGWPVEINDIQEPFKVRCSTFLSKQVDYAVLRLRDEAKSFAFEFQKCLVARIEDVGINCEDTDHAETSWKDNQIADKRAECMVYNF